MCDCTRLCRRIPALQIDRVSGRSGTADVNVAKQDNQLTSLKILLFEDDEIITRGDIFKKLQNPLQTLQNTHNFTRLRRELTRGRDFKEAS